MTKDILELRTHTTDDGTTRLTLHTEDQTEVADVTVSVLDDTHDDALRRIGYAVVDDTTARRLPGTIVLYDTNPEWKRIKAAGRGHTGGVTLTALRSRNIEIAPRIGWAEFVHKRFATEEAALAWLAKFHADRGVVWTEPNYGTSSVYGACEYIDDLLWDIRAIIEPHTP